MLRVRILSVLLLVLWLSACSTPSFFSLTPTPTLYIYPTPVTPDLPPLTVEVLGNAEYILPGFGGALHSYLLKDGEYVAGTDSGGAEYARLSLLDLFAFGDLNQDGVKDAAVLISQNFGGTGVFVSVNAVLNEAGQPRHAATYWVDDRPQIKALEIRDGGIFLDAVVHSFDDPACCPELAVTRTLILEGASLTLVHATSRLPGGQERVVTIESPSDGTLVEEALVIRGSVTIPPFENTLTVRVYNENGNELSVGSILVEFPTPAGPGSFTVTLDPSAFPVGRLRIVIADLSATDGSVLALDSVMVVVE